MFLEEGSCPPHVEGAKQIDVVVTLVTRMEKGLGSKLV